MYRGNINLVIDIDFKYVFSPATLIEIERMEKEFQIKNLEFLKRKKAEYFYVENNYAYFRYNDPFKIFEDHINRSDEINNNIEAYNQLALKLFGGNKEKRFDELSNNVFNNWIELINSIEIESQQTGYEGHEIEFNIRQLKKVGSEIFNQLYIELSQIVEDENYDPRKDIEKLTGLSSLQISNVKPPNVIEKIIEEYNSSLNAEMNIWDANSLLNWDLLNIKEDDYFSKIHILYMWLNMMGYRPDKKFTKDRRFKSSTSDALHACYAAFTDVFVTGDEKLKLKMEAIYEYVGANTKILYYKPSDITDNQ